jgi:DUF3088 family protein
VKDRLYLLRPNFTDKGDGPFFCSECAMVEGMLSFYPDLRKKVDVTYVDFVRPRPAIVRELGPEHQSSPVLVLGEKPAKVPATVTLKQSNGKTFIDDENQICNYLAATFATGRPHH